MSQLKLSEFDLYGTFRLSANEAKGLEHWTKKLGDDDYLSRSINYYANGKMESGDIFFCAVYTEYEYLNSFLPMGGKEGFVICEKMHELAIRVVNTIQQEKRRHLFQDGEHFDTVAQKCAQECADNLVRLMNNEIAIPTTTNLRDEKTFEPDALINPKLPFADNKKQLFMCANALPEDAEHLITPGRGSSKLGTIVQSVRKHKGLKPLGFTQIYYSYYKNKQKGKVFPEPLKNLPEKVLVMDDTIFCGNTLTNIKEELVEQGHKVTNGAITATFFYDNRDNIFLEDDWAKYIDIIPNQYANPSPDQVVLRNALAYADNFDDDIQELIDLLRNSHILNGNNTADFVAMQTAEKLAKYFGANLYEVSTKISPAAVDYNKKFRAQVEAYNHQMD